MKLSKLFVEGFRSFKVKQELIVDEQVTILIGANDHGKTNLLEAVRRLNDDAPITEDDKNYDLPDGSDCCITWHFVLSDKEIENIKAFQLPEGEVEVDKQKTPETKSSSVTEEFATNSDREIVFSKSFNSPIRVKSVPVENIPISEESKILGLRPKVELFKLAGNNLVDSINKTELVINECMQGIFRLAGLWEQKDLIFSISTETTKILNEASEVLTKALKSQWNQGGELEWIIKHIGNNGDRIELNIKDPAIDRKYSKPSLRSAGFRTYFLLSMITSARTANSKNGSFIFLFDEPATELHPRAQLDLQRSFEVISENAQIIYTTHSLFLINKNYPERNCVIKKTSKGSLIDDKPFINNWKSTRESLGILMSNNFLIADKTLLVEGPTDEMFILWSIKKLKIDGKIDIDINDFSIVDAGCKENYIALAKLMLVEGREIVALLDGNGHGEGVKKDLEKICEKEIKDNKLIIHMLPKNKSIEDVMTDHESLRKATLSYVNYLDEKKILKKKDGVNFESEIKKISSTDGKTLGKILEDVTKALWEPEAKISKLGVAFAYEDLYNPPDGEEGDKNKIPDINLPAECEKELKDIKKELSLRGERSKFEGVFEEVEK